MDSNVTIKHLRAFLHVARFRSFTRAAEAMHLSQPALTMVVRQLEDIVGASLFERTTRSVSLTPEGSDFLPTAERLLYDFDLAVEDICAAANRRRRRLGIASVHSVATKLLPHAIREFSQLHPDIQMPLRDGNSSDVRRRVRRGEVDIGFGSMDSSDPELDFVPLFRDRMGLLARADHPLLKARHAPGWKDLAGFDFIGLASETATRTILDQIGDLPESVRAPRYEVSNNTTLWAMLEVGNGITTAAALSAPSCSHALLRFRPLSDPIMWRTVYTVTRKGRSLSRVAKEFPHIVGARVRRLSEDTPLIEALEPASPGSPSHPS